MYRWILTLLSCLLLGACSLPPFADEVLFVDHFSDNSFFSNKKNQEGNVVVEDGVLKITVEKPNGMMVTMPALETQDVNVAINGWPQTTGETVFYGITCRYFDSTNFVFFSLGSNGDANITKVENGQVLVLAATLPNSQIGSNFGGRINSISAICNGPELTFSVNGKAALQATDPLPLPGKVGIFASSQYTPRSVIFDDLTISLPSGTVLP